MSIVKEKKMVTSRGGFGLRSWQCKLLTLFVIILFVNLPVAFALQISSTSSSDVTETSATITWTTDEEATSNVYYGTDSSSLNLVESNSDTLTDHSIDITGLSSSTEYYYSVESESQDGSETATDDNDGAYYSFTTEEEEVAEEVEEEDTTEESSEDTIDTSSTDSIGLSVETDEYVGTEETDVLVTAADNTDIRVYVNGGYASKDTIDAETSGTGTITFRDIPLESDQTNEITVEAVLDDLEESVTVEVYSDLTHPTLNVDDLSSYIEETSVDISGTVSEIVTLIVEVNGETVLEGEEVTSGSFSSSISLDEGENSVVVTVVDQGGLTAEEEVTIVSDTESPSVDAEISKGNEYYQNRAETDISGTTEAGATVYLFVYRPLTYDYSPGFDDAWGQVEADENGEFTFSDIDFENEPVNLESLAPEEVPSGLEDVTVNGIESLTSADSYTYYVYIIAEDESGKSGYYKDTVTVHSCYSQSLDFQITDVAKYQSPLRLDPTLMDDGREVISAVFTLEYRGSGSSSVDVSTGEVNEEAYQINSVSFEKACTQSMLDDDDFNLGCTVMGSNPDQELSNSGGTSYYLTWNLYSSEDLSDREEDFWNELKKRQVVFPIKVAVNYQERDATGNLGESKTQTSCYDLGYMVDVPVDSQEYIPDWLAEEGISAINFTVDKIDKVLPYLEKAILVTGIGCISSFLGKIVMRFARIASSNVESISGKVEAAAGEEDYCPSAIEQNKYYLQSTIDSWDESGLGERDSDVAAIIDTASDDETKHTVVLDERCPSTSGMWKTEAALESAYKWTCDRVFCRAVPARWTESATEEEVGAVILSQSSCAVSGSCIPLSKIENCEDYVKDNQAEFTIVSDIEDSDINGNVCWSYTGEESIVGSSLSRSLYYYKGDDYTGSDGDSLVDKDSGLYRLHRIGTGGLDLGESSSGTLLVYKEGGSDTYCAAQDQSCKEVCEGSKNNDYEAVDDGYTVEGEVAKSGGSCYLEGDDGKLYDSSGEELQNDIDGTKRYYAGYTSDCFVTEEADFYQCVCQTKEEENNEPDLYSAREALAKDEATSFTEPFIYRQDRAFKESSELYGTYYPGWRYYAGRDMPGAFGQDYLLDYLNSKENKKQYEVNPFTQHVGAFQSVCLSGIRARLVLLRNVLDGLQQCITEAKYTGFQDAGMCKTLFTQHVCGLVYKSITYFTNSCSPYGFSDSQNEGGVLGEQIKATFSSIEPAMQSGVDDLLDDYGNAALNEYFAGGAQGFAQSLCLAAFGYDFPLGVDFIQDAAYSVAMKTSVLITPSNREFTNYNPKDLTTIHNYEVGAVIFAGCRINNYNTYLKCVGSEDYGHPGMDPSCGGEGCDCLNIQDETYASQRIHYLESGAGYGVQAGEMIDIPIPSPQKIDSPYRYDHIVVEIDLDPNEEVENCFEEGYRTDTGGIFYQPIRDVSPPGVVSCQVETLSGRYMCPDIGDLFYGDEGLAYIESPYIECRDPETGEFESCGTPNMLMLSNTDKDLVVKPYIYTDGGGYCMKIKVTGSGTDYGSNIVEIPEGVAGALAPSIDIGEISSEMFGEYSNALELDDDGTSNGGCEELSVTDVPSSAARGSITFDYDTDTSSGTTLYRVEIPSDVDIESSVFDFDNPTNRNLEETSSGDTYLSLDTINAIVFEYEGFEFSNILGEATVSSPSQCSYGVQVASSSSSSRNEASIGVEVSLLQKPEDSSCYSATTPVEDTALGASSKKVTVVIQKESVAVESTSDIYSEFEGGDYEDVISMATTLIEYEEGTLGEVEGIYYYVASLIASEGSGWETTYESEITNLMNRFFLREESNGDSLSTTFSESTQDTGEFQSIRAYLCIISEVMNIDSNYPYSSTAKETDQEHWGCI